MFNLRLFAVILSVLAFTALYTLSPRTLNRGSTVEIHVSTLFNASSNSSSTLQDDLQSLLDFAIIGPPKMATTFLLLRLYEQPKLISYPHEIISLHDDNLELFVKQMSDLLTCEGCKRFYKKPGDSYLPHTLDIYRKHFPKTKIILGVRHPVMWFESFYSFRMRSSKNFTLPPADSPLFLGECLKSLLKVCPDGSLYHCQLALLGKVKTTGQEDLFHPRCEDNLRLYQKYTPNPVFLYEIHQVNGEDKTRDKLFYEDLSNFLELDEAIPPWKEEDREALFAKKAQRSAMLNICDDKYLALRDVLMENARNASLWIRNYFIHSDEVTISSREQFVSLVEGWMVDPCIERNKSS